MTIDEGWHYAADRNPLYLRDTERYVVYPTGAD